MSREENIKKWLTGELSEAERKQFEQTREFEEIDKLLKAAKHFKAPDYDVQNEYNKLAENVMGHGKTVSLFDRMRPLLKIAAVFLFALTAGYFLYQHFIPSAGSRQWISEQTQVYLPDSSYVTLNAASSIRYSEKKWEKQRSIELIGEAFFDVKEGVKFMVNTDQGSVAVLGTEFSVKDREGYYEVTCYAGSVQVTTSRKTVVLRPEMTYREFSGNSQMYVFSDHAAPSWLNEESSFRSIPLDFVIDELERQYQVTVEAKGVDLNQLFTGSFTHENLEIALQAVTIPLHLHYEIIDNKIVITVEGK